LRNRAVASKKVKGSKACDEYVIPVPVSWRVVLHTTRY